MSSTVVMSQEVFYASVEQGCTPMCHACDRIIDIGDEWGLSEPVALSGHYLGPGFLRRSVRSMVCGACCVAGRVPSREKIVKEIEEALARKGLTVDDTPVGSTTVAGAGADGGGCYYLETA